MNSKNSFLDFTIFEVRGEGFWDEGDGWSWKKLFHHEILGENFSYKKGKNYFFLFSIHKSRNDSYDFFGRIITHISTMSLKLFTFEPY